MSTYIEQYTTEKNAGVIDSLTPSLILFEDLAIQSIGDGIAEIIVMAVEQGGDFKTHVIKSIIHFRFNGSADFLVIYNSNPTGYVLMGAGSLDAGNITTNRINVTLNFGAGMSTIEDCYIQAYLKLVYEN